MYLFSYGSNSPKQLSERLGRATTGKGAYLDGYRRVFRGMSQRWGGGVASLQKHADSQTFGWVAKVDAEDLELLDGFEGVASGKYKRMRVEVSLETNSLAIAIAYVSTSTRFGAPTQEYLEACAKTVGAFWTNPDGSQVTWRDFPIR